LVGTRIRNVGFAPAAHSRAAWASSEKLNSKKACGIVVTIAVKRKEKAPGSTLQASLVQEARKMSV